MKQGSAFGLVQQPPHEIQYAADTEFLLRMIGK
jgi:hypothetical protein